MRLIGRRPLCMLCLCVILAGLAAVWLPGRLIYALCVGALIGTLFVILAVKCRRMHFYTGCMVVSIMLAILLGFGASARFYSGRVHVLESRAGETVTVRGMIAERMWTAGYGGGYLLEGETLDGAPTTDKFLLDCAFAADPAPGEWVQATGVLMPHEINVNGFAQRRYYLANGVAIGLVLEEPAQLIALDGGTPSLDVRAGECSTALAARLRLFAGREGGALLSALLLGREDDLGDTVIRDFKRLGLSHVLALSGMHLTLLCATLSRLLLAMQIRRDVRSCLQLVFVAGYVLLTGVSISVLRAAVMLALAFLARALFAEADPLTCLWGAAALICLISPAALLDIGLWMSVFATLAMLFSARFKLKQLPRGVRPLAQMALSTFIATMVTLPFVALCNGELAWLAVPANLIFVPLTTLLLYASPIVLVGGRLIGGAVGWLAEMTLALAARAARLPGITASLRTPVFVWCLLPFCIVCAILLLRPPKRWRVTVTAVGLSGLVVLVGAGVGAMPRGLDVVYAQTGQSEVLVLREAEGTLICDIGDGTYTPLDAAATYAAQMGATEIDTLMLTHYHTRHISGVLRLGDHVILRRILLPTPSTDREREIARDITDCAKEAEIEVAFYPDGLPICYGKTVLTPYTRTYLERSAQPLILLGIERSGEEVTYLGASVRESALLPVADRLIVRSERLILGRHGPIPKQVCPLPPLPQVEAMAFADETALRFNLPDSSDVARGLPIVLAERIIYHLD